MRGATAQENLDLDLDENFITDNIQISYPLHWNTDVLEGVCMNFDSTQRQRGKQQRHSSKHQAAQGKKEEKKEEKRKKEGRRNERGERRSVEGMKKGGREGEK